MVLTADFTEHLPMVAVWAALAIAGCAAALARPRFAILLWFLTLISGQLVRLPLFGQAGGLLPSDIANLLVLGSAGAWMLRRYIQGRGYGKHVRIAVISILPFLCWGLFILLLHKESLGVSNFLIAFSYWARLAVLFALIPAFVLLFQEEKSMHAAKKILTASYVLLLMIGYVQMLVMPSLEGVGGGWDPHRYRMVATWLDPNFFGAFLAIAAPYAIVGIQLRRKSTQYLVRAALLFFAVGGIVLTQSRSTFLSLLAACAVMGVLFLWNAKVRTYSRRLVIAGMIWGVVAVSVGILLLGDRGVRLFLDDPTVTVRAQSYTAVWNRLAAPNILTGVGYNTYQFAAREEGLIHDYSLHSRAGSDSSILTLLVTTGAIGTGLFFAPLFYAVLWHIRRYFASRNLNSIFFVWSTVVILVHSQFTNSFLYPHLLMVYVLLVVISLL